jgi:uncharacterized protein (DUF2062 family)
MQKTREMIWPSMGWRRLYHYYKHRTLRGQDTTYRITAGLATGAAISFSPFIGTQIIQATIIATLIRASWIAAIVGTIWGNPWTFPFIFWCAYKLGVIMCIAFGGTELVLIPEFVNLQLLANKPWEFFSYLIRNPVKLFLPLVIGGYACALISWPVAYAILYFPVKIAQKSYNSRRWK